MYSRPPTDNLGLRYSQWVRNVGVGTTRSIHRLREQNNTVFRINRVDIWEHIQKHLEAQR